MASDVHTAYVPDSRLRAAYGEANQLDEAGLEALCPSYIELSEVAVRYRNEELVGRGAVKEVYRTYDSRAKRRVAMARLREDLGPEFYETFVNEAWLTASLNHPNIIKIYDVGVEGDGRPFFTMDLKGNTTLADLMSVPEAADLRNLLTVLVKICEAIAYAHSRGVLHLDLKPENIQVDAFGEVLVCDWGLGRLTTGPEEGPPSGFLQAPEIASWFGVIKGSPGYMSPEHVKPTSTKDHRTDIYALGCLLHFIITGEPPFTGPAEVVLEATARGQIRPPSLRFPNQNIPPGLEAAVMKATAYRPLDRYQSALDLRDEIRNYLRGYATRAEQPGFLREAGLFLTRNRVPVIVALAALILMTVLSVLFIQRLSNQRVQTAAQRERASRMESKAELLAALYQGEVDQATETRSQLAARLSSSANSLKNLGIFSSPLKTVRETGQLVEMALILDPSCQNAIQEGFTLDCIKLNFAAALESPPPDHLKQSSYLSFCEAFPDFEFTRHRRPSVEELSAFFRKAAAIDSACGPLMERILAYDMATRAEPQRAAPALFAMLEYINGGSAHLSYLLDPDAGSLLVKSKQDLSLRLPGEWGASGHCLLRFLTFPSLKLEVAGRLTLSDLEQLPIESLDLSGCDKVDFSHAVTLPLLREVRLRHDQVNLELILRKIISSRNLQVLFVAESH